MNINEFSKRCGVSPATVSRYFSGNAAMSPALAERIRRTAEETGYKPSAKYQRRKVGGNGPVVAIIPYLQHRFQTEILAALQQYADSLGRQMLMLRQNGADNRQDCIQLVRAVNPAGVVLLHEGGDADFIELARVPAIPMVMCSGLSVTRKVSSVHVDDLIAAYDGANYLIGLGHKSIVLLSDKAEALGSGSQRVMGCQKAFLDAGLELPVNHIAHAWHSFGDGYSGMNELLRRGVAFTAVFAFSDEMAAGAIAALCDNGLRVPEDVSVLGFDNGSRGLETRPMLSTVGQPIEQIAARCIDIILSSGDSSKVESIVLPHAIIERESCRRL